MSSAQGGAGAGADEHGLDVQPTSAWSPRGPVVAWIQDASIALVTAHSSDGGATWRQSVPPLSTCDTDGNPRNLVVGNDARITVARLAVDGAGVTVLASTTNTPDVARGWITVTRSADGGATWSAPTLVSLPAPGPALLETMSADPTNPHAIAMTWFTLAPAVTWFARSTDDGKSWSVARPIDVSAAPGTVSVPQLITLPDGTELVISWNYPLINGLGADATNCGQNTQGVDPTPCRTLIYAIRSTDHGSSWSGRIPIVTLKDVNWITDSVNVATNLVVGPDGAAYLFIPVDRHSDRTTRTWRVYRSANGLQWSDTGIRVPLGDDVFPWSFAPYFAIAGDGTIGALYADHRLDAKRPNRTCRSDGRPCRTDEWLTYSRDRGATWSTVHLGHPFDLNRLPGDWVGDFEELHGGRHGFAATFALGACEPRWASCRGTPRTEGLSDVYYAQVQWAG